MKQTDAAMRTDAATRGAMLSVINPYDGKVVGEVEWADQADVARAIERAQAGSRTNRALPRWRRADFLNKASEIVARDAEDLARMISSESGKPIKHARKEVRRATNTLLLCAEEAKRIGGEILPFDNYGPLEGWSGHYTHEPLGIIIGITPFNDPFNLVAHKVGPALAAGNSIIVKPSEHTPLSAIRLAAILTEAGAPEGLVQVLVGSHSANQKLVADHRVRMVSFTGGPESAEKIMREAGLKRFAMELGGNSSVIVMADADVDRAVNSCVSGAFWANGQNCIGVQRIFVHSSVVKAFCEKFRQQVLRLKVGDPTQDDTDVGPLITDAHAARVERIVHDALSQGAQRLCGGERVGRVLSPTVLLNTPAECAAWHDEIFGPVVNIEPFDDVDAAIARANAAESNIHAAIFTRSIEEVRRATRDLEGAGIIVNDSTDFRHDGMPFGGSKYGGIGREGVRFAIAEMTQTKMVAYSP
jgi:glyceraldehyde-3-phosphate dehydrogenase (NADP+)